MEPEIICRIVFTSDNQLDYFCGVKPTEVGFDEVSKSYFWEKQFSQKAYSIEESLQRARKILSEELENLENILSSAELRIFLAVINGDSTPSFTLDKDLMNFFAERTEFIDIDLYSE